MSPNLLAAAVLFVTGLAAGALSALQAAVNGRLASHTGTLNAVLISISVSFAAMLAVGLVARSPKTLSLDGVPPHLLLGGLAGLIYVAAMTYLAPRIGVTPTLVAAIAGQLLAAIVLDHFGILRESPMHLHEIGNEIEERIARRFPGHAIVHVDPLNSDHEHYETVRQIVEETMAEAQSVTSFHDLRLLGSGERLKVIFDVATEAGGGESETRDLRGKIEKRLRETFPHARVVIDVEPPYFRSVPEQRRDPVAEDSGPE